MPIDEAQAHAAALELARPRYPLFGEDHLAIDAAKTEERELGWLLYVQSKRFLESRDGSAEILNVEPVFVHRQTGAATMVKPYGPTDFIVDGQPGPDWPRRARVIVPVAVAVQAIAWVGFWSGLYLVAEVIGLVLVNLVAIVIAIVVLVLPAGWVIDRARFRNFHPWAGLMVVLLGIGLGELAAAVLGVSHGIELELFGSIEVPAILLKALAAAGMGAAGMSIGQQNKSHRGAWESSRVIAAPPEQRRMSDSTT